MWLQGSLRGQGRSGAKDGEGEAQSDSYSYSCSECNSWLMAQVIEDMVNKPPSPNSHARTGLS